MLEVGGAEFERLRDLAGEVEAMEVELEEAILVVVPAGDAGEIEADGTGGGVGEVPGGEASLWIVDRLLDALQALGVVGEGGDDEEEGESEETERD